MADKAKINKSKGFANSTMPKGLDWRELEAQGTLQDRIAGIQSSYNNAPPQGGPQGGPQGPATQAMFQQAVVPDNRYSNAPGDWRVKQMSPGIAGAFEGFGGMMSDGMRGAYNGAGDAWDYLSSQAPGTSRPGTIGFGPDIRKPGSGRGVRGAAGLPKNGPPPPAEMTFADYLALANQLGLGGSQTDYTALMNQLRQNAADGDAKLEAMYGQLRGSIDADAVPIGQTYDTNQGNLQSNADQATATTNAAYQAARDAQTQQFQQLGIQDAAAVLADQGGAAAADQANAVGNIAQNTGANLQQNAQNRTSALTYNTNIGNAAGLEGAVQRAAMQQQLANKLAELQVAQSSEAGDRQQSLFSAAFQMAQNPGVFDPNYRGNPKDSLEMQKLAAELTSQNLKNQGLAANQGGTLAPNLAQLQTVAQQMGVDPSNQEAMIALAEYLKTVSGLTF